MRYCYNKSIRRLFSTQTIKSDEFNISVNYDLFPHGTLKVPFIFPHQSLHHRFASHFRKQFFAPSFLKDPYCDLNVNVMKIGLPFYVFKISAHNIVLDIQRDGGSVKTDSFRIADFELDHNDKNMQLFVGNYAQFTKEEVEASKISIDRDIFSVATKTHISSKEINVDVESAYNVTFGNFIKALRAHASKHISSKYKKEHSTFKISASVNASLHLMSHPVYLLIFGLWGSTQRVQVNGVTGEITGPDIVSPLKVAAVILAVVTSGMIVMDPYFIFGRDSLENLLLFVPLAAICSLCIMYYFISRQSAKNPQRYEKEWKRFFQTAEEAEKRTFYQNWFLFQANKEELYHKWYRDFLFEDHKQRHSDFDRETRQSTSRQRFDSQKNEFDSTDNEVGVRPLYNILGVNRKATPKEIEKAFKDLTKIWHPDKFGNKTDRERRNAEKKFNDIITAYKVLQDGVKRRKYDMTGETD